MANLKVEVQDGNNLTVEVTPVANQIIMIDRGVSGGGGGTVTSVSGTGSVNGITLSGTVTSIGDLTLDGSLSGVNLASQVTGTLPIANGGTNATTSGGALSNLGGIGTITSTDGSVTVSGTGTSRDLSVAVAGSTTNVICLVRNNTGATLTKGTAVYINGSIGQNPTVAKALATSDTTSAQTLGLMTADLANNANGYVTLIGLVSDINTSAYTDGAQLYLSYTTAGALTATKPKAPNHMVYVAVVEHAHPTQGKLFVKVQNGYELDELHDVQITSPANGQTIIYDATASLWKNANLTAGSGISITNGAGSVTIAATGGGGSGTVTSVSGTGTVNGLTLSGTVTGIGDLTLDGSLDLSAPPAIGGTTPNTITGTTVTAFDAAGSGIPGSFVIYDPVTTGVTATFTIDPATYLPTISATDGAISYPLLLNSGATFPIGVDLDLNRTNSLILSDSVGTKIYVKPPTTIAEIGGYNFILPTSAGSANQVLKTDGTGVTSWTTIDPLTLTGISDPTAPTNTNTTIYSKSFGGYATLAGRNALNTSFGLQSALWSKNIQIWTNTTGINGLWINTGGIGNGNYTRANPTIGSTTYQSCGRSVYANLITTTNQVSGVQNNQQNFFRGSVAGQGGFFFYARVGFDTWTNGGRLFVGMGLSTTVVSADPSASIHVVGFCIEAADNGAISFITRAGSGAATKASTGLTAVTNKGYDCYIYCSPNSSQYTWQIIDINTETSVSGTATNSLPVNTQPQYCFALASNAALTTAGAIKIGVAKIYVESDN